MSQPATRSEFAAGWKVLVAAMLGIACGASPIPYNSIGFLLGPLRDEFGWSFRDISLGLTLCGLAGALLVPVYG
jgi:MFS transporter, OFA family, oxalate/formate antiporter